LVFCSSEALHIIKIVWNTSDEGDRLAGFKMVIAINATKTQEIPRP
jgi:hypothetical protein